MSSRTTRRPKSRSKPTGSFRSQFEASVARSLKRQSCEFQYEAINLPYTVTRNYKPDFVLENGIFIECKGYLDSADQRKMRAIKDQYPDLDIRMLFMRLDGKVQGSKMTNLTWCEKYDFPYAQEKIPKGWINEEKTNHQFLSGTLFCDSPEDEHREEGD